MKKITIFLITSVLAFGLVSCDSEHKRTMFTETSDTEFSFMQAISNITVDDNINLTQIDVVRNSADSAVTITVDTSIPEGEEDIFTVSNTLTFDVGEFRKTIDISYDPAEVVPGNYVFNFTIPEQYRPLNESRVTAIRATISRPYEWEYWKEATLDDPMWFEDVIPVTIQKAIGFEIYRIADRWDTEGYDLIFTFDETTGEIGIVDGTLETGNNFGYLVATGEIYNEQYGMIYAWIDTDPEYSYYDSATSTFIFNQRYAVINASNAVIGTLTGWYDVTVIHE